MSIHVTIGEAETRLGELVAAVIRGEDVVLDQAGHALVRLVAITARATTEGRRGMSRQDALGMFADHFVGYDLSLRTLKSDRTNPDERYRLKFADFD